MSYSSATGPVDPRKLRLNLIQSYYRNARADGLGGMITGKARRESAMLEYEAMLSRRRNPAGPWIKLVADNPNIFPPETRIKIYLNILEELRQYIDPEVYAEARAEFSTQFESQALQDTAKKVDVVRRDLDQILDRVNSAIETLQSIQTRSTQFWEEYRATEQRQRDKKPN